MFKKLNITCKQAVAICDKSHVVETANISQDIIQDIISFERHIKEIDSILDTIIAYNSLDLRIKTNIVSLGSTLAKLLLIDGKTYTMKKGGKQKIGVLAQDIQKVFPELVTTDDKDMLAVNYQGLVPVLINALKEQQSEIDELKQMVNQLITKQE